MRKVYEHVEFSVIGRYQSLLEGAGILTHIKNMGTSFAAGEVPFTEVYPELWVVHDEDYDRALEMLSAFHKPETDAEELPAWTCDDCAEEVDGNFAECWNCSKPIPTSADNG